MTSASPQRRVLVVDDDDDIRLVLSAILADEGFGVEEAVNGQDALDRLATEPLPDVVLLDLMMPVMDGWEVLRRRRADARLSQIPVVLLSANPNVELVDGAANACECLLKPVDLNALLHAVGKTSPEDPASD